MNNMISIIVPVYNSAIILPQLCQTLLEVAQEQNWNDIEVLMIDDGSVDQSFSVIKDLAQEYSSLHIKGMKLSRNFGHQNAVAHGLQNCLGDYVAIIDDDMQDPPQILPLFYQHLQQGYDVAIGVRRKRQESFFKVFTYKLFYRFLRLMSEIEIPLDSGDFCMMKRRVVKAMLSLPESNPFHRGIRSWVGYKQIGVEYNRGMRAHGESGYTLRKLFRLAFDGIYSFSTLPLRMITVSGFIGLILSLCYSFYILGKFFLFGINVPGFTTIALLILFFGSINLLCMGIVGEYMARIYSESKRRPYVIVAEEYPRP